MNKKVFNIEEAKQVLGLNGETAVATEEKTVTSAETKAANDVMHTSNTGHGEELVIKEAFSKSIIDEVVNKSTLLSALPGFHGYGLPQNLKVPVRGEFGYFENAPEYTSTTGKLHYNDQLPNTAMITLKREKLIMRVPVSNEMLRDGIDIEGYIRSSIAQSWSRTIESIILNADNTTGTNNINSKGENVQDGDVRHWFRPAGLRKTAMEQDTKIDIGALDETDLFDLRGKLGDKASVPADCIFVMNTAVANKLSQLPTLKQAYASGRLSTVIRGMETNILGSDIYVSREMRNTLEDGLVSQTATENEKGQILYFNKNAPQFGFDDIEIEAEKVYGYGFHFVVTGYFAHAIASKLVGTDPSVAVGVNIEL